MDLRRPRISLSGEELTSLVPSSSSSWSLPIRAPLTFDDDEEEEEEESGSDYGPSFPRIKLSSPTSCSSCSEAGETASGGTSVADPAEETAPVDDGSPKDWIFRPSVASSGGNSGGDPEGVLWHFEEGPVRAGAVVPIARLSMEFDIGDDEEVIRVGEEIEEDGVLARVPGFGVGDEEGRDEGSELRVKMKCRGGNDRKQYSDVLGVSVCEATSSSDSEDETSDTDGVARGITGVGKKSGIEMNPCGSDGQNRLEMLELSDDLSVKDSAGSYVSDDESEGFTAGNTEVEMTLSPETKSCGEDRSALAGVSIAENLWATGALETAESSMEETSFESSRVMEVQGSKSSSGLIPIEEVVVQDLDAEENDFREKTEVGVNSSDFTGCMLSSCHSRPKQARENEQNTESDSEPESDGVKLINLLEDASVSWVSSLTSDIEKIVGCDRNSDRYEPSNGEEMQVSGSESADNLEKDEVLRMEFQRLLNILDCSRKDSVDARVIRRLLPGLGENTDLSVRCGAANELGAQPRSEGSKSGEQDFSLNIIVLGKPGVGKSSAINSILGEQRAQVDPLGPGTANLNEILGRVCGIKVRLLDTPGLRVAGNEQGLNRGTLSAVKNYATKFPPDVVLFVDRLDSSARDSDDHPILQTITRFLGPSIWEKAVLTMTHAASFPSPDGQCGSSLSYETFLRQRLDVIWGHINGASGLTRIPPLCLVENTCGQEVLQDGERRRLQLLMLCCSMKIMAEATSRSKPLDSFSPWELLGTRVDDWKRNTAGAKQGSTGDVCVPQGGIILDVLIDSSMYASHGEHELSSLKLEVRHLRQPQAQNCLGNGTGEDENADVGIKDHNRLALGDCLSPYEANLKVTVDPSSLMGVGGDSSLTADLQSRFSLGHSSSKLDVLVGFRDKQRWKITIRTSSSDSLRISALGFILPVAASVFQFLFHAQKSR